MTDIGEKASNLLWLLRKGYRVPTTFVLPFNYYEAFLSDPKSAIVKLRLSLQETIEVDGCYAVRSSANLEDSRQHSFAGQFRSFLNVSESENILLAVQEIWQAVRSASIQAYIQKSGQSLDHLRMAVIIQEMVTPGFSGVAFSKNPLTGLNEVIVEAVSGSGDQLVQEGITPERWVYRWGDWTVKPSSTAIGPDLLLLVAQETTAIARKFGSPVDLEWVYDGQNLSWVQLRPITHLEEINIYSNRISREVFPGFIKPLIWSVNVPLVNTVWINLFSGLIGPNELKPQDLARQFAYRAYFNMGTIGRIFEMMGFPRESLEILLGLPGGSVKPRFKPSLKTISLLPRLLGFMLSKLRLGPAVLPALAEARSAYESILKSPPAGLGEMGLLAQIDRLYLVTQEVADYNVSVPLLMSMYNGLLARQLTRLGVDYTRFDLTYGLTSLEEYDPNVHIRLAAVEFTALDEQDQAKISSATIVEFYALENIQDFQEQVKNITAHFGHLSDSGNDFSVSPWRETPALVLQMILAEVERIKTNANSEAVHIKNYINDQHLKSQTSTVEKINWQSIELHPLRRWLLRPIYNRARLFRLYREAVSSTYTYGYGLFRIYFLELGNRFVERGLLVEPEEIFYLYWDEIRRIVVDELDTAGIQEIVSTRKAGLASSRDFQLPETIYGEELPPFPDLSRVEGDVYTGIPSSRGYYRGPVKVIRGLGEFAKMEEGDVLVIPFSDVSWTPLFTRAGAVIAESGGILSHSSIVAREFNLPCVVSVSFACQIPDNTQVTVDGFKGVVVVHGAA